MTLTTLTPDATVDDLYQVIQRDGGVIVKDFIDAATLAALKADITPALDKASWGSHEFTGVRTRRLGALFKHTQHVADIALHPLYHEVAERFLILPTAVWSGESQDELPSNLQIGMTQAIDIYPGEGAQPLHRDDSVWHWRHPEGGRQARVQIMVAVTDFTADNGGTRVIPGSHKWDDERAPRPEETVPTEMTAGSALIWIGATYHGGGSNSSDAPRMGITMSLDLGFLRQEENHYLALPRETVKALPEPVQRLLGYEAAPPFVGWVEVDGVMSEPIVLLADTPAVPASS
ncbi:phytanoyl-CoA dioxygenase family protein [Nonomuraea purpurea]|uniref:Phytanoyl-CoA dioxygenase family protein n=1 Tax=Nonomuraea purpurea TaxID=1849276 RepID=A0ABV8GTD0_9ACTN